MRLRKKGNVFDIMWVFVLLFILAIGYFAIHYMARITYGALNENVFAATDTESRAALASGTTFTNGFDYMFIIMLIGFVLYLMFSVSVLDSHPVFFIIGIVVLIIFTLASFPISNAFQNFAASPEFLNESDSLTATSYVFNKLPVFMLIIGALTLIFLYAKIRGGGE